MFLGKIIWWSAIKPKSSVSGQADTSIDGSDIKETLVPVSTLTPSTAKFAKSFLSFLDHSESPEGHVSFLKPR